MNEERLTEFLSVRLELWESYHNHKENMANAGFLVQLSLFGSIVSEGLWPPDWVTKLTSLSELMTFLVYFVLWFLIHFYTRWQLINKRVAAFYFAGIEKSFLYFSINELTQHDKKIFHSEAFKVSKMKNFISKIIYIPGGFSKMDASLNGLPNFIAREIKSMFIQGSGAEILEILITYTSFLLLVIVSIKIFFS